MKNSFSLGVLLLLNAAVVFAEISPPHVESCIACHGIDGISSNPEWPSLAGQKIGYLDTQLKRYRDGLRNNPPMAQILRGRSDSEIAKMARYYSDQPLRPAASGDTALIEIGENLSAYCKACHGMTGQTANSEWPNLAGQQAAYLEQQLISFSNGQRDNAQMKLAVSSLSKADFSALAAYYSQLQPVPANK